MKCIEYIDESQKLIVTKLVDEIVYLEEQMEYLKSLPQIKVNPNNQSMQKITEASKMYKVHSQSYMNALRILLGLLNKKEEKEQNALLSKLSEFM